MNSASKLLQQHMSRVAPLHGCLCGCVGVHAYLTAMLGAGVM